MGWSISTRDLTCISSFAQAEKHWADTAPWKTEDQTWRPLGNRRARHKRLVKLVDGGYACVLYNTAMVTYYPDDSVLLNVHDSMSSQDFSDCMAPAGCRAVSHQGCMYWKINVPQGVHYYRPARERLHLRPAPCQTWEVVGALPDMPVERKFDRALGAATRKALKPYFQWLEMTERLTGKSVNRMYSPPVGLVTRLLETPSSPELYLELCRAGGSRDAVTRMAYLSTRAVTSAPVPYDRLPKRAS